VLYNSEEPGAVFGAFGTVAEFAMLTTPSQPPSPVVDSLQKPVISLLSVHIQVLLYTDYVHL